MLDLFLAGGMDFSARYANASSTCAEPNHPDNDPDLAFSTILTLAHGAVGWPGRDRTFLMVATPRVTLTVTGLRPCALCDPKDKLITLASRSRDLGLRAG